MSMMLCRNSKYLNDDDDNDDDDDDNDGLKRPCICSVIFIPHCSIQHEMRYIRHRKIGAGVHMSLFVKQNPKYPNDNVDDDDDDDGDGNDDDDDDGGFGGGGCGWWW